MSVMDDLYNKDLVDATITELTKVFLAAGVHLKAEDYATDIKRGVVILDGMAFGYSRNRLRLMGFCPTCGQETISTPIRRVADITDLKREFRADRHTCMDV